MAHDIWECLACWDAATRELSSAGTVIRRSILPVIGTMDLPFEPETADVERAS